jgi:hypothetical protein
MSGPEISKLKQRLDEALWGDDTKTTEWERLPPDKFPQWYTDKSKEIINKLISMGFTLKVKNEMNYYAKIDISTPSLINRVGGRRTARSEIDLSKDTNSYMSQWLHFGYPKYPGYTIVVVLLGIPPTKKCRIVWQNELRVQDDGYHIQAKNHISNNRDYFPQTLNDISDYGSFEEDLNGLIEHLGHFKNGEIVNRKRVRESIKDWWGFNPTNSLKENSDWVSQIGNIFKLKVSGSKISNEDAFINIIDLDPEYAKDYWKEIDQIANANRFQLFDVESLHEVYGEDSEDGSQLQFEKF